MPVKIDINDLGLVEEWSRENSSFNISMDAIANGSLTVSGSLFVSGTSDFGDYDINNVGLINGVNINTLSGSPQPANIFTVAKSGAQFNTIGEALLTASNGDDVLVYPGVYSENITIPAGVRISGFPSAQNVILEGSDTTSSRVIMSGESTLANMTISGPSNGTNAAINVSGLSSGETATLTRVVLSGNIHNSPGILGFGEGTGILTEIFQNQGDIGNFIEITGGDASFNAIRMLKGTCDSILRVSGSTARAIGQNILVSPGYTRANQGIVVGTSASLQLSSFTTPDFNTPVSRSLNIVGDAVVVDIDSSHFHSNEFDFFASDNLTGNGSEISLNGVDLKLEQTSAPSLFLSSSVLIGARLDTGIKNDKIFNVFTELSVGYPTQGRASSFGEGDSSTSGMLTFLSSSASGFTDITEELSTKNSGSAVIFPQTTSGSVFYIGTSGTFLRKFPSIRLDMVSNGTTGSGGISFEYMSGSNNVWKDIAFMATDANFPYTQRDIRLFDNQTPKQIRFDIDEFSNWVTSSVNGSNGYWMRMKVSSSITTSPEIRRITIGSNRTEINFHGFIESYGRAEKQRILENVSLSTVQDLQGSSPGNNNIDLTPIIRLTPIDNQFNQNTTDGFGQLLSLPYGIDTSRNLIFQFGFFPQGNSSGNIVFQFVHTRQIDEGSNVNNQALEEIIVQRVVPVAANRNNLLHTVEIPFKLRRQDDNKFWAFAFRRVGDNVLDTLSENITICYVSIKGYAWAAG